MDNERPARAEGGEATPLGGNGGVRPGRQGRAGPCTPVGSRSDTTTDEPNQTLLCVRVSVPTKLSCMGGVLGESLGRDGLHSVALSPPLTGGET